MFKRLRVVLVCGAIFLAGCSAGKEIATAVPEGVNTRPASDTTPSMPATEAEEMTEAMSEEEMLERWMHFSGDDGAYVGIGTERAYTTLLKDKIPQQKVIVAVIDSGVDITHEDISIWKNTDEIPENGIDDDQNGYVDDVYGWNFIGGADGDNVYYDTFEVTREMARLNPKYEGVDAASVSEADKAEYSYYIEVKEAFEAEVEEMTGIYENIKNAAGVFEAANSIMADFLETDAFTIDQVKQVSSPRQEVQQSKDIILYFDQAGISQEQILDELKKFEGYLEKGLNTSFDPRGVVGDNYADLDERYYGNNNVTGPDAFHGTHVAGIIGAFRNNELGIDGIANSVEIMAVRAVPKGDERDKDIANAIRYAVDNGADVINMSFGKQFSPHKSVVDEAVKYAAAHDVLLVHAAGNESLDNDNTMHFPLEYKKADGGESVSWIEVGASSWEGPRNLAASFSNYGRTSVDVFAPGVDIYSTVPDNKYKHADGTSMASPVVAGLAALLMAYYPQFTAGEIKAIILDSAVSYADQMVTQPGSEEALIAFGALSETGGIVNAYRALELAEERSAGQR